jgi:curved DNA-binding protein CbpA
VEHLKDILDGIGEEKLKALYGQKGYNAIENFSKIVAHVDKTQGGGIGKFLNLTFLLPFRSGMTAKGIGKVSGMAFIANRAAKIITSPEGVKIYEDYITATTSQTLRLASAARDEMIAFNEKSDKEFELEQQIADDEYKATLPQVNSTDFGSETWRKTLLK